MKRSLAFALALLFSMSCCFYTVFGEESENEKPAAVDFNDLSSLSDKELLSYDNQIEEEKAKRGISVPLQNGAYLVGRDIAPGYYKVKFIAFGGKYDSDIVLSVFTSKETYDSYEKKQKEYRDAISQRLDAQTSKDMQVYLEEGQVLYVFLELGAAY